MLSRVGSGSAVRSVYQALRNVPDELDLITVLDRYLRDPGFGGSPVEACPGAVFGNVSVIRPI